MFQIFQITRINFDQYLQIHKHPDTYSTQRDATTQTEHTTIKPKHLVRSLSNRMRSEMEKQRLNSYWPSDNNDDTDEELEKDPPEARLDDNYTSKTYTYVSFYVNRCHQQRSSTPIFKSNIHNDCSSQLSTHSSQLHRRPTVAHLHPSSNLQPSAIQFSTEED